MPTKLSEIIAQQVEKLSPTEQSCLLMLLKRLDSKGSREASPTQSATDVIHELVREWIFASHYGQLDSMGSQVSLETIDTANEAWQNFPRKMPVGK
jgi:hypothetical protein